MSTFAVPVPMKRGAPAALVALAVRDQREQVAHDGVGDRRPLGVAQHAAVEVELLALAQALVAREEERLVLHDGAAQVRPELVPLEGRLRLGLPG